MILAICLVILFLVGWPFAIHLYQRKVTWRLDELWSRRIKWVHYGALGISVLVGFSYGLWNIGLAGLWTTRILILTAAITGLGGWWVLNRNSQQVVEKHYFTAWAYLPMAVAGLFVIPLLGVLVVLSLWGQLVEPAKDILWENDQLRVQTTFVGPLGPPAVEVFGKQWPLEKRLARSQRVYCYDLDSVAVTFTGDSGRVVLYCPDGSQGVWTDTIPFAQWPTPLPVDSKQFSRSRDDSHNDPLVPGEGWRAFIR